MIAFLRAAGGDTTQVEVKSAAGGLPASLTSTLSALANQPGGGIIILGLDERAGFRPIELSDPQILKQGLAARARAFTPPVRLTIDDGEVDGATVVVAQVHECDRSTKPCRVTATGRAYLRGYDGDYALSDVEEQGFLAARQPPLFDRSPVEDATVDDLDTELVDAFPTRRTRTRPGRARPFSRRHRAPAPGWSHDGCRAADRRGTARSRGPSPTMVPSLPGWPSKCGFCGTAW